jgi:hypothetical protein
MTDEQWEKAAREYCRLAGLDPDKEVEWRGSWNADMSGATCDCYCTAARWQVVREQLEKHAAMNAAIECGRNIE